MSHILSQNGDNAPLHTSNENVDNENVTSNQYITIVPKTESGDKIALHNYRRLNDKHFNETVEKRGLDKRWVEANCYSGDIKEVSEVLHYQAKSAGIIIDANQIQVRPDKPWRGENDKKAPKYRTPLKDDYDAVLPINPDDPRYWTDIEKLKEKAYYMDDTPCLFVTEGGFKAIAGSSNGLPTIGLCGVEMGLVSSKHDPEGKRYLIPSLRQYADHGFGFIIAFDADCATNPNVIRAEKKLAYQLEKIGVPVYSITGTWTEDEGKGMDDFIKANGIEAFREKLIKAELVRDKHDGGDKPTDKETRLSDKELIQYCRERLNLRYNEMTREIEIDGKIVPTEPYLYLVDKHDITVGKDKATDIFMMVAKENTYNPVKDYLESLTCENFDITNLATRYLGTENPLYDLFIEKMLIGAVARAYQAGCKLDTALVLQGEQGIGKSSFFDVLGGDYFDDSMGNGSDKDDLLTLHRSWIQEWGELDRIFGKKAVGEVKSFLSKRRDNFREPYARKTECFPRHSIIVGSVNDASFLNDSTGARRFWVVPVEASEIDIPQLKKERDQIWAAAVQAYKAGRTWWLTKDEESQSAINNQQFQIRDEWQCTIEDFLGFSTQTTVHEILANALNMSPRDMDKGSQMRVSSILRSMGWIKKQKTVEGKRAYVWIAPPAPPTSPQTKGDAVSKTQSQIDIAPPAPPAPPFSETLTSNSNEGCASEKTQLSKTNNEGDAGDVNSSHAKDTAITPPQSKRDASNAGDAGDAAKPFETYPSTRSDNYRHKEKLATKCKERLLACQTQEDIEAFKSHSGFSENEYKWVWHNLLSKSEKARLVAIANTQQQTLSFDSHPETFIQVGDKVWISKEQQQGTILQIHYEKQYFYRVHDQKGFTGWHSYSELELLERA